ncbi:MAG: septum formation inhibitor Maf [Oscillospiraceae bacterium]|nr:septum formation inhibitor Maf [Oscillospiraceae bacterium]
MKLILASASPRRKELLGRLGVPFEVIVSDCDESLPDGIPADQAAELLAVRKAAAVAEEHPDAVVIGADTTVILDDLILGKPRDRAECCEMLRMLSGRQHKVVTGVAVFWDGRSASFSDETLVQFYPLTEAEISAYADTDEPYDKAGAYGIQGQGGLLVAGISGDYPNVVGLPVSRLVRQLRAFGLIP